MRSANTGSTRAHTRRKMDRLTRIVGLSALITGLLAVTTLVFARGAVAAEAPVGLGTAASFAVLAGTTVTNTGPTVVSGNVGVSPGSAVTGFFTPGIVVNGSIHQADAVAAQAQSDVTTAYNDEASRALTATVAAELGGTTLKTGVYSGGALEVTGTLTLDGENNPDAVFIIRASSTLITASGSKVSLINGAQSCNVFWQVVSAATLGTDSAIAGNILALTSITAATGAVIDGRLLARNGAVTLDSNVINQANCLAPPASTTTIPVGATTTSTIPVGATTTSTIPVGGTTTTTIVVGGTTTSTIAVGATTTIPTGTTAIPTATTFAPFVSTIPASETTVGAGPSTTRPTAIGPAVATTVRGTTTIPAGAATATTAGSTTVTTWSVATIPVTGRNTYQLALAGLILVTIGLALTFAALQRRR